MCCAGSTSGTRMTRIGFVCGLAALGALSSAFFGPTWLHTEEKFSLSHLPHQFTSAVSVRFKLGFFKVCPKIIKPPNITINITAPPCTVVKYNSLADITSQDLGFNQLEFTPLVISKMRISAPFQVVAIIFILSGTLSAMIGHCLSDHKTIIACGFFLLGGLSLGGGLIILASALSDASYESPKKYSLSSTSSFYDSALPQYQYGWCLQLSGLALILAEIAALLTVSGYMARFPTVEEMVRVIVPGAARKLEEQHGLSSEYLIRSHQKSPGASQVQTFDPPTKGNQRVSEEGKLLLYKSAPDICASNPNPQAISYVDKSDLSHMLPAYPDPIDPHFTFVDKSDPSVVDSRLSGFNDKEGLVDSRMIAFTDSKEHNIGQEPRYIQCFPAPTSQQQQPASNDPQMIAAYPTTDPINQNESLLDAPLGYNRYNTLAGQTVPITLKRQNSPTVSSIQSQSIYQNSGTIYSGTLKVSEPGTSSNSNFNTTQRSTTLPKRMKPQIAQHTFSTLECEKKRNVSIPNKPGFYTGSAV